MVAACAAAARDRGSARRPIRTITSMSRAARRWRPPAIASPVTPRRAAQPFAGGLALQTPFGAIMTPNITPDDATGIGRWSADDFARAMHEGRRPDGTYLYPAFPYPYYTKVTREDRRRDLRLSADAGAGDRTRVNRRTLPFPFSIRPSMSGWNALFFTPGDFAPDPEALRGIQPRRLSGRRPRPLRRLPHAAQCPSAPTRPTSICRATRSTTGSRPTSPTITQAGLGKWSVDDIVQYLKTGQTRTQPRQRSDEGRHRELDLEDAGCRSQGDRGLSEGTRRGRLAGAGAAAGWRSAHAGRRGHLHRYLLRLSYRATAPASSICFRVSPATRSSTQDDPSSLVRIILTGGEATGTDARPTSPAMPSLGYRLNDSQVAAVVTYIRNSWGNAAPRIDADTVRTLRGRLSSAGN